MSDNSATVLRVNLSNGKILRESIPREGQALFIGGGGGGSGRSFLSTISRTQGSMRSIPRTR